MFHHREDDLIPRLNIEPRGHDVDRVRATLGENDLLWRCGIDEARYRGARVFECLRCLVGQRVQPTMHIGVRATHRASHSFDHRFRPNIGRWPVNVTEADKKDPKAPLVRDFEKGQMARDMTVFVDDDGKGYLFAASEDNATLHISELTDDFLKTTGKYVRVFPGRMMEAPAVFKRAGKYYLIASGCTAWEPNAARSAVADSIWGPWKELGNPCVGEKADITFQSQGTYVLEVAGKPGRFVFMADRWNKNNLPDSRYVWLPIAFEGEKPVLRWMDRWSPK